MLVLACRNRPRSSATGHRFSVIAESAHRMYVYSKDGSMNVVSLPRDDPCNILGVVAFNAGDFLLLERQVVFVEHHR